MQLPFDPSGLRIRVFRMASTIRMTSAISLNEPPKFLNFTLSSVFNCFVMEHIPITLT